MTLENTPLAFHIIQNTIADGGTVRIDAGAPFIENDNVHGVITEISWSPAYGTSIGFETADGVRQYVWMDEDTMDNLILNAGDDGLHVSTPRYEPNDDGGLID